MRSQFGSTRKFDNTNKLVKDYHEQRHIFICSQIDKT